MQHGVDVSFYLTMVALTVVAAGLLVVLAYSIIAGVARTDACRQACAVTGHEVYRSGAQCVCELRPQKAVWPKCEVGATWWCTP